MPTKETKPPRRQKRSRHTPTSREAVPIEELEHLFRDLDTSSDLAGKITSQIFESQAFTGWQRSVGTIEKTVQDLRAHIEQLHLQIAAVTPAVGTISPHLPNRKLPVVFTVGGTASKEVRVDIAEIAKAAALAGVPAGVPGYKISVEKRLLSTGLAALYANYGTTMSGLPLDAEIQQMAHELAHSKAQEPEDAELSAEEWDAVKTAALEIIGAHALESPSEHLAYVRARVTEAAQRNV